MRSILDDQSVYEGLKLMGRFSRLAGYQGLLVGVDEMVNLYKLPSGKSRNANYERLLSIVNDSLQGSVEGLGFLFAGTPEFLTDPRRGLYLLPRPRVTTGGECVREGRARRSVGAGGAPGVVDA